MFDLNHSAKIREFELKTNCFAGILRVIILFRTILNNMIMKEDVLQRVKMIYEIKSTSETQFAKQIGASQKTINQQFKGERSISLDTILQVLCAFEDISSEWLLRGNGNMYVQEKQCDMMEKYDAVVEIENGAITIKRK